MSARPFFKRSIQELEKVFAEKQNDPAALKELGEELRNRDTRRASKLRQKVFAAYGILVADAERPETGSTQRRGRSNRAVPQPNNDADIKPDNRSEPKTGPHPSRTPRNENTSLDLTNSLEDVLDAWTAMEVLSPVTFVKPEKFVGDEHWRIAKLFDGPMPWHGKGERSRKNQKLFYQIVLGSVFMRPAVDALLEVYSDTRPERPSARGEAILATVTVNREGRPIENEAVSLSSFGWGLPVALAGDLKGLADWSNSQDRIEKRLEELIVVKDEDGKPQPLTFDGISAAFGWLVDILDIGDQFVKPPTFAVRTYQHFKIQEPPESLLMNSFFLEDLALARAQVVDGSAPQNLSRFLSPDVPNARRNLLEENDALEIALEPIKFPLGAWPGNGRHPLVMLQQCAVNLVSDELDRGGILAVNGPPGTGKTTLLRDVIAGLVTERAVQLATFSDPNNAFIHSREKISRGKAFLHLYKLDPKIRGYEVVVASSNNKAVENVTKELPSVDAVTDALEGLRYFSSVADNVLKGADDVVKENSWGMIAAALGKSKNRSAFRERFWWDKEAGLQTYLQHAAGMPKVDGRERKPSPEIVARENPPSNGSEALTRWHAARRSFQKKLEEVQQELTKAEAIYELRQAVRAQRYKVEIAEKSIQQAEDLVRRTEQSFADANSGIRTENTELDDLKLEIRLWKREKPGWFERLWKWSQFREWKTEFKGIRNRISQTEARLLELRRLESRGRHKFEEVKERRNSVRQVLDREAKYLQEQTRKLQVIKEAEFSRTIVDDDFFALEHKEKQVTAPWLDDRTKELRQELFVEALHLHKAFIDAAAKPIRHNLNAFMDSFGMRTFNSMAKDQLIPHLWSTLFLIVPVISTTFASVSRMFTRIGNEELGWLLIDEAGQALPQAAVGALMRTKRAVVVGDPMQIEPVVSLPDHLTEAICGRFGIDPLIYNAPVASVQTLADSATNYFATFETQQGTREVGVPLLVHRRCSNPMFQISNRMAYQNLMVLQKGEKKSRIRDLLEPSRWIDIKGDGRDKWCEEEGDAALEILDKIKLKGIDPDIYFVTPFVVVQDNLRRRIVDSKLLDGWVDKSAWEWVRERVGTVHTVQGREAEAVVFVLGAPKPEQRGARNWAGGSPNLANVAVTRAKEAVYVIGNRDLWQNAGVFAELHKSL